MEKTRYDFYHSTILGNDPTAEHQRLYAEYPEKRGFSDNSLDVRHLEAVVLLALIHKPADARVVILAPVAHESWVLEKFNSIADTVFGGCKKHKHALEVAKLYAQRFKRITLTGRLLQLEKEPDHWVSFGFRSGDVLPSWMRSRLL